MGITTLRHSKHTARKDNFIPCYYCGERVLKGETYVVNVCSNDGKLESTKMHTECDFAFQKEFDDCWPGSFLGVEKWANDRGEAAKEGTIHEF